MAKILLIDDDELVLDSLRIQLEAEDHAVTVAEHGGIGLRAFQESVFDVVVTDIHMPEMEGIGTIQALRKIAPDTLIIAMTGGSVTSSISRREPDYLRMAHDLGATDVIQKPFTGSDLLSLISKYQ